MHRPATHSVQLWLRPWRPIWYVGAGWAVVGGGLASGAQFLPLGRALFLVLAWFLVDPLLGTVWDLGACPDGLWGQLRRVTTPGGVSPVVVLPYTRRYSPAWSLGERIGHRGVRWHNLFSSDTGQAFVALTGALATAIVLGAALGPATLMLVVLSALLSWLSARLHGHSTPDFRSGLAALHALGEFGIPWLIGCLLVGSLLWPAVILGACLTIAYTGVLQDPVRFRLVGGGQLAAVCLLVGLRQPLAATAAGVFLIAQWGLHSATHRQHPSELCVRAVQPFILASLLVAALAVAA
jgi:hypothetical protein